MWRDEEARAKSARKRLALAAKIWRWRPHLAQARFFCCVAQVRVAACGRRWGKTESLSIDIASLALMEPDCRQLVVAPTEAQARLLGEEVLTRLRAAFEWRDSRGLPHPCIAGRVLVVRQRPALTVTITEPQPSRPNPAIGMAVPSLLGKGWERDRNSSPSLLGRVAACGGVGSELGRVSIVFRTAGRDGRSLRGLWAHRIVVDEAARVPDSVLTEVLLPMLMDRGGEYVLASSPFGRRSAYYRLYAKGMAPTPNPSPFGKGEGLLIEEQAVTYESFQCPTSDNPHLEHAFLQAQREELGEALYAQEFGAQFIDDFGAVFREADIDAGITEIAGVRLEGGDIVSEPEAGRLYTLGIDWGRKLDFTVAAVLEASAMPAKLVYLQRWQGTGWEAQARAVAAVCARFRPWRVLADGNSIGDPLAETLQAAVRAAIPIGQSVPTIERFTFGQESKLHLIDRLTLGLSARTLVYPAHRTLLAELRAFEYGAAGASGRAKMGARAGTHDDIVIALALAWHAAPAGPPPPPLASRMLLGSQLRG